MNFEVSKFDLENDDRGDLLKQFHVLVARKIAEERDALAWRILCSGRLLSETQTYEQLVVEDGFIKYRCWAPCLEGEL